ncbi:pentatricopeptide repeat-containing protein At2g33680 [Lolium perenne]|uniref:pentatricopeptide repeat-containing protein At2g33680 n=1 Tax=Lolium perenne TaxID=4522 RepID=UPI0021EAC5B4|nr:pentatricopeptide repeat-containing protein At2g33680 [Lolium perenne]XP_051205188.1 pentatricopeptide repeat-containing protein At2g33680 [Lolium perenne]XP_051205189.1 pentatricopeptide repeat-containing protein At2g33680 [Lolium perenne]
MAGAAPSSSARHISHTQFVEHLRRAARARDGEPLHAWALKSGAAAHTPVSNSLITFYSSLPRPLLPAAFAVFADIPDSTRDVASWNSLINPLSRHRPHAALSHFRSMLSSSAGAILPSPHSFAAAFTAAARARSVSAGAAAHALACKLPSASSNVFVSTALVNMYCKLDLAADARRVFDEMPERNGVSWSAMLAGYAAGKCSQEAFELFRLMLGECPSEKNEFVATAILSAVSVPLGLPMGIQLHGLVVKDGFGGFVTVENSLVTMYAKAACMDAAFRVFESAKERESVTWSAMITGYAQNGDAERAVTMFSNMHAAGFSPNEFTFVGALNGCSDIRALVAGKQAHGLIVKLGHEAQIYVKSALVDMYAKCGCIGDARVGFDQLYEVDIVLWTAMVTGHVQNGEHEEALSLYSRMDKEGIIPSNLTIVSGLRACASIAALEPGKQLHTQILKFGFDLGTSVGCALSTMYSKCGNLEDSLAVFRRMPSRDVIAWNSIIGGFSHNGCGNGALDLFEEMKLEGTAPDHVTFINVLWACSHMGLVHRGWIYFRSMTKDYGLTSRLDHYSCMVDMLSRAGMLTEAKDFIESITIDHGTYLWGIVLGACRRMRDFDIGAYAGERLMELGSEDSSAYILLSNIYAAQRKWNDVERVRHLMKLRGVSKDPGCSWVELNSRVHVFVVGEQQHPEAENINVELRRLAKHMKDEGYCPTSKFSWDEEPNTLEEFHDEDQLELELVSAF